MKLFTIYYKQKKLNTSSKRLMLRYNIPSLNCFILVRPRFEEYFNSKRS